MTFQPSVLCPIDFSDSSHGALRYAGAIAAHFGAPLTLLAVNDPLLREAGIIVMGLHSSPVLGARMGSVTYRVLCLAHRLVLALPPLPVVSQRSETTEQTSARNTVVGA